VPGPLPVVVALVLAGFVDGGGPGATAPRQRGGVRQSIALSFSSVRDIHPEIPRILRGAESPLA